MNLEIEDLKDEIERIQIKAQNESEYYKGKIEALNELWLFFAKKEAENELNK